jgi:hypothetical protein
MRPELRRWNNGSGIDLEGWVGCSGNFSLAVGYTTVFWPEFERNGKYILRKGIADENILGFETGGSPASVEAVLNHLHLSSIHYGGCEDLTSDKLVWLGRVLREIYQSKLAWQFPDDPCEVDLYMPDDREDLWEYQITFWQKKWDLNQNETDDSAPE